MDEECKRNRSRNVVWNAPSRTLQKINTYMSRKWKRVEIEKLVQVNKIQGKDQHYFKNNLKWCGGKNRSNTSSSNLKNVNVNWLSGIVICGPFYTSHIMSCFRHIWKKLHSCLSDVYSLVLYVSVNKNKILKYFINSLKENKYYKSIRTLLWNLTVKHWCC